MKLRRGFKAEAEAYACGFREKLGLRAHQPLDMFLLARHLAVPVLSLRDLAQDLKPAVYKHLTTSASAEFSAVTLCLGSAKHIVYNDSHAPTRQQSDLAHELAHIILGHSMSELTQESGGRHYNKELEDEAACLSGVLLLPQAAALWVLRSGKSTEQSAADFNISMQMMTMRLNQSGAKVIVSRTGSW
ncbi:ImmA/IrrE family metallo-endopeptidase [Polaromonas sp. YR568]|uniref:ImmA/IrrE family metallo-endopeptidase n=1 Tax=Polaromonas sp. YR568 TaxID=1855301 RepID=UPI00398BDD27